MKYGFCAGLRGYTCSIYTHASPSVFAVVYSRVVLYLQRVKSSRGGYEKWFGESSPFSSLMSI